MAEALARRALDDLGWDHVEVRSAGTAAPEGGPASKGAVRAAAKRGLDLGGHRSRSLSGEALEWADLVLVMSPGHLFRAVELGGGDKTTLLTSFAAGDDPEGAWVEEVPDPFGGPDEEYEATLTVLERLVERSLRRLEPILAP
jgi:protein-tyrosine phosphatase